jgi:hypothetical protein
MLHSPRSSILFLIAVEYSTPSSDMTLVIFIELDLINKGHRSEFNHVLVN